MEQILDGSSDYDAHVRSILDNFIYLEHLFTSKAVKFIFKYLSSHLRNAFLATI